MAYRPRRLGPSLGIPGTSTLSHLFHQAVNDGVRLFFTQSVRLVARMDVNTLHLVWSIVSATTEPVLAGSAWSTEFRTMTVIAAALVLPLLCAATLQAVARQDAGGLLRTALVRVPLALLLTAVVVELVSLGLQATDQACGALISDAGQPLYALFARMSGVLYGSSPAVLAVNFFYLVLAGVLAFLVWIELAVRSAAIALATLFFPLALAGSALPATAHWARRLGETVTALVLSKLAIVAALTLAVGTLGEPRGGIAPVVEGITLLGLAAVAPLSLARILPMVEAGAIAHLDGLGRSSLRTATNALGSPSAWMSTTGGGAAASGGLAGMTMHPAGGASTSDRPAAGGVGTRPPTPSSAEPMRDPSPPSPPPGWPSPASSPPPPTPGSPPPPPPGPPQPPPGSPPIPGSVLPGSAIAGDGQTKGPT